MAKIKKSIVFVVGTRPNFIKAAPILKQFEKLKHIRTVLIHTGQHFDYEMSRLFFKDLNIRKPDYNLNINGATHGELTARMLSGLEKIFMAIKPEMIIAAGDVDSTLAAALAASKLCIPVAHVEAGLRSFDMMMPEEVNRIITDRLSDLLFTHSPEAKDNLVREGISPEKIYFVGNVMIDMLKTMLGKARNASYLKKYGLKKGNYALLTLHRPSNVDEKRVLENLLLTIRKISKMVPVIFPVHPRSKAKISGYKLEHIVEGSNIIMTAPLGYMENLSILKDAKFVLTDSGGIQEETTYLHIPCLTLRENTERPVTAAIGTNTIVGNNRKIILTMTRSIMKGSYKPGKVPKFWDGNSAQRIYEIIKRRLGS
ncbi:MAG: non-hydrolyzing UDP-N-acetylglucosamine 2-epimerase [Ignavibacteria bacterium]